MPKTDLNTSINIIASISDFEIIFRVLELHFSGVPKEKIKSNDDIFSPITFRTISSKTRALNGIVEGFGKTASPNHNELLAELFRRENNIILKRFALLLQLALNNKLFYDLTKNLFLKRMFLGNLTIRTEDVESYIYSIRSEHKEIGRWSDSTIHTIAYKYLILMKKLGLAEGKVVKEYTPITPRDKELLFFIYFINSIQDTKVDFTKNSFIDFLLIDYDSFYHFIKSINLKKYISIESTGTEIYIINNLSNSEFINELLSQ